MAVSLSKLARIASILAVLFLLALLVWPTPYLYKEMKVGDNTLSVRINRLTGDTYIFYATGWEKVAEKGAELSRSQIELALPDSLLRRLEATVEFQDEKLICSVYNPTNWTIHQVRIKISWSKSKNPYDAFARPTTSPVDSIGSREYVLEPSYFSPLYLKPFSSLKFSAQTGFRFLPFERWSWQLVEAKGTQETPPS